LLPLSKADRGLSEQREIEQMDAKLLLKPEEAAARLSISRASCYQLLARGELRSVTIGRSRRVPVAAIEDYIARLLAPEQAPWPR
jgi:excisionase family DNA binding protein